jgi:hypothetical protein
MSERVPIVYRVVDDKVTRGYFNAVLSTANVMYCRVEPASSLLVAGRHMRSWPANYSRPADSLRTKSSGGESLVLAFEDPHVVAAVSLGRVHGFVRELHCTGRRLMVGIERRQAAGGPPAAKSVKLPSQTPSHLDEDL